MLCVYGHNPFGDALSYIQKKHPDFVIQQISEINNVDNCHLLFIGTLDKTASDFIREPDNR